MPWVRKAGARGGVTEHLKAGWDDDYLLQILPGIPARVMR
jgi:hypothetical protein